jgi:antibiotic biosynthesis monooxygenase (ABM) superfamily enzyme
LGKEVHEFHLWLIKNILKVDDWLYERDVTRRMMGRYGKITVILVFVAYTFGVLLLGVIFASSVFALAVWLFLHALIQTVNNFAVFLNLANPSEFTTILTAEVIAILGSSIIARMFSREPKRTIPHLYQHAPPPSSNDDGVRSLKLTISNEHGQTAARQCEASVLFDALELRDIIDHAGAQFGPTYSETELDAKLLWNDGKRRLTLRSGQEDVLEVLREVPAKDGIEAHFEVPSSDPPWKSTICLRLKTFYIKVRVMPINGPHCTKSYTIRYDSVVHHWELF